MDELEKCEQSLFDELMSATLYLNCNGIPIDKVKEMLKLKVDTAILTYKEMNLGDKWREWRIVIEKDEMNLGDKWRDDRKNG